MSCGCSKNRSTKRSSATPQRRVVNANIARRVSSAVNPVFRSVTGIGRNSARLGALSSITQQQRKRIEQLRKDAIRSKFGK